MMSLKCIYTPRERTGKSPSCKISANGIAIYIILLYRIFRHMTRGFFPQKGLKIAGAEHMTVRVVYGLCAT
jgi:hypothetical protein